MFDRLCPIKTGAKNFPHRIAIATERQNLSYWDLERIIKEKMDFFRFIRIEEGMRILIQNEDPLEIIFSLFALWRMNASATFIHLKTPPFQKNQIIEQLKPAYLIEGAQITPFPFTSPFFEPSLFLYTSGSTGAPKLTVLSARALLLNASSALTPLRFDPEDRWLLSLPLYHVGGIGIALRAFSGGGSLTLSLSDLKITHLSYVPTQLFRAWPIYPRLKCLLLGGAPIPSELPSELPIFTSYGLSEMGSIVSLKTPDRKGSFPLEGREVALSETKEILVKGETLFQGYWEDSTLAKSVDEQGWFHTKDIGHFEPSKGLSIIGRMDWMFISGGRNIHPEEIEKHLLEIPGIIDAMVAPKSDPEYGAVPIALLQSHDPSLSHSYIESLLLQKLPKYKIPKEFKIFENLPKKGIKIDRKKALQELL